MLRNTIIGKTKASRNVKDCPGPKNLGIFFFSILGFEIL